MPRRKAPEKKAVPVVEMMIVPEIQALITPATPETQEMIIPAVEKTPVPEATIAEAPETITTVAETTETATTATETTTVVPVTMAMMATAATETIPE